MQAAAIHEHQSAAQAGLPTQSCPACGGSDFRFRFEKKGRRFWRCAACGLERQWPLPSSDELAAYYEESYQNGMYREFAIAGDLKRRTAEVRLGQLASLPQTGTWLDVGCSSGVFLELLRDRGIAGQGVEISQAAVDVARRTGLDVQCGTLEDLPEDGKFDVITAFDVLEHVLDPLGFVQLAAARLKPGGALVITVPNLNSFSRLLMGRRWYFYIPEEHLHYCTPWTLNRLVTRAGLTPGSVRSTYKPLTLDYSLIQFQEYNPWIYCGLSLAAKLIPGPIRRFSIPLYIGEMLSISFRPE